MTTGPYFRAIGTSLLTGGLMFCLILGAGCSKKTKAIVDTPRGSFTIQLYEKEAPKTVENFRKLVKDGFFDGLTLHRVEPGFVVQGGDPKGDGTGGPAYALAKKLGVSPANTPKEGEPEPEFYTLQAEINEQKHVEGTLGMARQADTVNPERQSNGSQFYICLNPQAHLDGQYTVFAQVIEGMSVVKSVQRGDKIEKIRLK